MTVGTATEPLLRLSYVLMLVEAMTHARSLPEKIAELQCLSPVKARLLALIADEVLREVRQVHTYGGLR